MEEKEMIDQSVLAEDVANKINYDFIDSFLVKPLDPVKVKKEFSKPVEKTKAHKDANDVEAVDYDEVTTEVKEVDSDYRKGIVLKVPMSYSTQLAEDKYQLSKIKVGDVVVFRDRSCVYFDLIKDSRLVRYYEIVAIER